MSVRHTQRGRRQFVRAASSRGVSIRPPSRFPSAAAGAWGSGRIDSGIEQRRGGGISSWQDRSWHRHRRALGLPPEGQSFRDNRHKI